jgi:carbamoyl-phosphate synthase large subunit
MRSVMVLGSGPIVVGQAAEFDYAGSQACRTLRELGLKVILMNSNPATIMTDTTMADRIYLEPLNASVAEMILRRERPQGLLPTLGGQVGLNLAVQLAGAGILEELGVTLLGTPVSAIRRGEDRDAFRSLLGEIGEPCPASRAVRSVAEALDHTRRFGFPMVVRPAYTLGGEGSGVARDRDELAAVVARGLARSPARQCLVEEYLEGWREIEFEIVRDGRDNCLVVCGMENLDPMGIHTGDSIVVAPCQTLSSEEYHALRGAAFRVIRALGIEGGCNIQFALAPEGSRYHVIEVNPRVSRSSALASKATGFPIAAVTTRIALGYTLDEIRQPSAKQAGCYEPVADYVVVKIPRWPFDKFAVADRRLGTQMKATGEVMGIDRTFEGALLKAVRSLDLAGTGLFRRELAVWADSALEDALQQPDDRRLFVLAEACRRGLDAQELTAKTGIPSHFIERIQSLACLIREVEQEGLGRDTMLLRRAKRAGFSDRELAAAAGTTEQEVEAMRRSAAVHPVYKAVDAWAAGAAEGATGYYSTYEDEDESPRYADRSVLVVGSGPIRIGQGIEFDYCSVHAAEELRAAGLRSLVINNNPETVSTDPTTSDCLFLEPITREEVREVIRSQAVSGVLAQFGGQTALNLAAAVDDLGAPILGTGRRSIDRAEDRHRFDRLLGEMGVSRPSGNVACSPEQVLAASAAIGYPVIVRPSYVLGGRGMTVLHEPADLSDLAGAIDWAHPVWVDRFIAGRELEVDALADGRQVLVLGIMEHVEGTGVHSGDSLLVYPPQRLDARVREEVLRLTTQLALSLEIQGLVNLQYVLDGEQLLVLEANPRASRTVPILAKILGFPAVRVAARLALGSTLNQLGLSPGLYPEPAHVAVKAPVFSWSKLPGVDSVVGPEMKSTGEVLGIDWHFAGALTRALEAAGLRLPADGGTVAFSLADRDKRRGVATARAYAEAGLRLAATAGTAAALDRAGLPVKAYRKLGEGSPNLVDGLTSGAVDLVINTFTRGAEPSRDGHRIRRAAVEQGVPCLTALDTADAVLESIRSRQAGMTLPVRALQDYLEAGRP